MEGREYSLLVGGVSSHSACTEEIDYTCTTNSNYWDSLSASEAQGRCVLFHCVAKGPEREDRCNQEIPVNRWVAFVGVFWFQS